MAPTPSLLLQMMQQNDEKHEEAHIRIRTDHRSLEQRVTSLEAILTAQSTRLTKIETSPLDVMQLKFSTRVVVSIVSAAIMVAISQLAMNASLKNDVAKQIEQFRNDIITQTSSLKETVQDMKRRQELQQYELQQLTKTVNEFSNKRNKQ